jgi:DNA-directed RNA polymerase specialized sigma24 family protein
MGDAADAEYVEFVSSRLPKLRRAAYRLCGDWTRGDDIVSRTLTDIYVHWAKARLADNLDAYIRTVMVHRFIDEQRRGWSRVRLVDTLPDRPNHDNGNLLRCARRGPTVPISDPTARSAHRPSSSSVGQDRRNHRLEYLHSTSSPA